MSRRTWLALAGLGVTPRWAQSQYVLPPQRAPAERFPPSREQDEEITSKMTQLQESLATFKKNNVADESLVEVEIFHKAATWIGHHNEYFTKNSVPQTIALLDTGI